MMNEKLQSSGAVRIEMDLTVARMCAIFTRGLQQRRPDKARAVETGVTLRNLAVASSREMPGKRVAQRCFVVSGQFAL